MNMHDNEDIDALFRSKLNEVEVEPSAKVWAGVSCTLKGEAHRKSLIPLLRIAASIILVLSAGVFLVLKDKKANKVEPKNGLVTKKPVKKQETVQQTAAAPVVNKTPLNNSIQQHRKLKGLSKQHVETTHYIASSVAKADTNVPETIAVKPVPQPDKAPLTNAITPAIAVAPAVPDNSDANAFEQVTPDVVTQPVALANNTYQEQPEPVKKRGIHGLGSLINAVVASVDKRQDKLVEFTDTDDGDRLTGINLGIIKIKKQN
jgi:hypothetical protein